VCSAGPEAAADIELVIVLGGTARCCAARRSPRRRRCRCWASNLGRVGFLAEAEQEDLAYVVDRIVARDYASRSG